MYATHIPFIRDVAIADYDGFADVVTFAALSVRQQFIRVPAMMDDVRKNGAGSHHLWGWKGDTYAYVHTAPIATELWRDVRKAARTGATADALKALVQVPGLGLAKSGFVAQMLGFNVACFDSRNMKFLGMDKRKWRYDADYSPGILAWKIEEYIDLSRKLGGAEYFWDRWCTSVAEDNFETPERVSRMHLAAVQEGIR